jgi:hypothetical protein
MIALSGIEDILLKSYIACTDFTAGVNVSALDAVYS